MEQRDVFSFNDHSEPLILTSAYILLDLAQMKEVWLCALTAWHVIMSKYMYISICDTSIIFHCMIYYIQLATVYIALFHMAMNGLNCQSSFFMAKMLSIENLLIVHHEVKLMPDEEQLRLLFPLWESCIDWNLSY